MARHAELQTVDDRQTVFLQGYFDLRVSIWIVHRIHPRTGEVGGEFYFVLQGSVAIKMDNKIIKVRHALYQLVFAGTG